MNYKQVAVWNGVKPYAMMVLLQIGYAGMFIVAVASLKHGMSHYVLVAYRNAVATAAIAPFALFFDRKTRPKLTARVFFKILALAILEPVLDQNLFFTGSKLTSAGFATALVNVLPAVTFLLALLLRIEKVQLRRRHSQAKLVGTVFTVAGAVLMILYKGPALWLPWNKGLHHAAASTSQDCGSSWLMGTVLVLIACLCWSGFFLLQSNTLESYPAELSLTALICLTGTLLSGAVALVAERGDPGAWVIGLDTRLFTVVYSGVVCSGVAYYMQGVVSKLRGPVFVTAFNPLCMIVTAVMGSVILKEDITLGSVIGAAIIVAGLYCLIWGKSADDDDRSSSGDKAALHDQLPVCAAAAAADVDGAKAVAPPSSVITSHHGDQLID